MSVKRYPPHVDSIIAQGGSLSADSASHAKNFGSRYVSVNVLATLDLCAQQAGVWMHALRAAEINPAVYRCASIKPPCDPYALFVVLSTRSDTPIAWQEVGHALHNLIACAAHYCLYVHVYPQMINVAEVRACLCNPVWPYSYPQILLQIGYSIDNLVSVVA